MERAYRFGGLGFGGVRFGGFRFRRSLLGLGVSLWDILVMYYLSLYCCSDKKSPI